MKTTHKKVNSLLSRKWYLKITIWNHIKRYQGKNIILNCKSCDFANIMDIDICKYWNVVNHKYHWHQNFGKNIINPKCMCIVYM